MRENFKIESKMFTAGGRISCDRCTAKSSRTGLQCARPALKSSKTKKCQFHGGRGSGAKTLEGKLRIAQAHTTHGNCSKASRQEQSRKSLELAHIEDMMYLLEMTSAPRSRGRKPKGYWPITTIEAAKKYVIDTELHRIRGSFDDL